MPCYDSRNEPENVRREAREEWMHNSPVAEMLCEAMSIIQDNLSVSYMTPRLHAWWTAHRQRDALRNQI
jgi:hypothetical protein